MQPTHKTNSITNPPWILTESSISSPPEQGSDEKLNSNSSLIDPSLSKFYHDAKIHSDGRLRLENIALPETIPLQSDAVEHIQQFMTTPFVIQGMVTETIRNTIRHILRNRLKEPAVAFVLEMDFMKKTEPVLLETTILPAQIFLRLLEVCNGDYFKLIGGEARKSLKNTFKHMVELIQQKPCVLSARKEKEYLKPCPDWDFIIPAEHASYEQLLVMSDVVPNIATSILFGQYNPEVQQLLQFIVREVLFKISKIFDNQYCTGVSFGNPDKKIDITFLPKSDHNFFFEFNKVGIIVHRNAVVDWLKNAKALCEKYLSIDASLCGPDKGLQAGFDYIHNILRSSHYQQVNKRGFASLMLWLSRGFTCCDAEVLISFYKRLEEQGNPEKQIAEQLSLSHESHFRGNRSLFLATYLNAFLAVNLIHSKQVDVLFHEVIKLLTPALLNGHSLSEKQNTFEIILNSIKNQKFNIRYYLDWLTTCAFLNQAPEKRSFGKTALQLNDEASLLLPIVDLSAFEGVLENYSTEYAEDLKKLFNHLVSPSGINATRLNLLSEDQKEKLKTLSSKFLEHSDVTIRRVGLKICLLFIKSDQTQMEKLLLRMIPILKGEKPDAIDKIVNYVKSCVETLPNVEKFSNLFNDLIALLKTNETLSTTNLKWINLLLITKEPQLIEIGMLLWKDLTPAEKTNGASEYIREISSLYPHEALSVYNQHENHHEFDQLGRLIFQLKSTCDPFISYGLALEKAVMKTLTSNEGVQIKGRRKHSSYSEEYFWLFIKLSPLIPDKALRLFKKLQASGCIDLDSAAAAEELIRLHTELPPDLFYDIWSFAQGHSCPLQSLKSKEKNECLVSLCEKLLVTKNFKLDSLLNHAITQDLDDKQKNRLQKVIQDFGASDPALRNYLSQDQIIDMSIAMMHRQLKERQYLEVSRGIERVWPQTSGEKRERILVVELLLCTAICRDMKQMSHDKRKQLSFLAPLIETRFFLFDKAKSSELSSELAGLWVLLLIDYVELSFAQHSGTSKLGERIKPFIGILIEHLANKKSYVLAFDFLQTLAYSSISVEPDPFMIGLLFEISAQSTDVLKAEQTMGLLKFYQHPRIMPKLQIGMYIDLIHRLLESKSPKANLWIERLLSFCSKDNQLPGKIVIDWVKKLTPQTDMSLFAKMYSKRSCVQFDDEYDLRDLLNLWLKASTCPYFSAKLICEETYPIYSGCSSSHMIETNRKVLHSWIISPSPECTEEMLVVLKLYQGVDAEIWCKAIEIMSKASSPKIREECWLMFEFAKEWGAFNYHPALKARTCLHALRGISGLKLAIFEELLLTIEVIRQHFRDGTTEEYEEALWIIFREKLNAMKEMKDRTKDTLAAMTVLATRNYVREIKPWSRIDHLIVTEMVKMGDKMIIVPLLSSIKNKYTANNNLDINSIVQLIFESLSLEKADCYIALSAFLTEYINVVNVFPLLKMAIKHPLKEAHLSTGILIPHIMNHLPKENDRNEKILVSCLTAKIADVKSDDKRLLHEILDHPNVTKWLSDHIIAKCWESIIVGDLEREARAENPLSVVALASFKNNFHRLNPDSYAKCLHAGIIVLIRLLIEGCDKLETFHQHTISFFKTIMRYQGETPTAGQREPKDLPRTTFSGKPVHSKEDLVSTIQRVQITDIQTATLNETKRNRDNPILSFPNFESLLQFIIGEVQGKDELHAPEFAIRGVAQENMPDLSQEMRSRIIKECTQKIEPAAEPKEILEIETIDYIFKEKSDRDFYILGVSELIKQMCSFHTSNLDVRRGVTVSVARQILFLLEHYKEYRQQLFAMVHHYVFAASVVDFQHGLYRTPRGRERFDQAIFDKHTKWCHEIITTMRESFSKNIEGYPHSFYESMLVIYPFEIYPTELLIHEQGNVIFKTVNKLLSTQSSLHFARALEIVRTLQNIILNDREDILDCYNSLIFAMLKDPYYLINEKNLIVFGPEDDQKECLYTSKRPLFQLLSISLRENDMKFRKGSIKESLATNAALSVQFINALFDLMENPAYRDPHHDMLDLIVSSILDFAKRGCFVGNHAPYRDFIVRVQPHVLARLRGAHNKKEALRYLNLPFLFLIPFQFAHKAQKEHWVKIFNHLIRDLLEIKDKEMNEYVIEIVRSDFINKAFYTGCKPLLAEIKAMIENHSSADNNITLPTVSDKM